jgi:hypothetical protein
MPQLTAPVLIAPSGTVTDPNIIFQWEPSAGAVQYTLRVESVNAGAFSFTADTACFSSPCTFAPSALPGWTLPDRTKLRWRVIAIDAAGNRVSSSRLSFNTNLLPASVNLIAPQTETRMPSDGITFQWANDLSVTDYRLTVIAPDGTKIVKRWDSALNVCLIDTCSKTVNLTKRGEYKWFVHARRDLVVGKVGSEKRVFRLRRS